MGEVKKAMFRALVDRKLAELLSELDAFEQTTHGSLMRYQSILSVVQGLADAYVDPKAFSISELAQRIDYFLTHKKASHPGG